MRQPERRLNFSMRARTMRRVALALALAPALALVPPSSRCRRRALSRAHKVESIDGESIVAATDRSRPLWVYDPPLDHVPRADEWTLVVDARAPGEFAEDHVPGAVNLPVLDDAERAAVGAAYAADPFAARVRGAALVAARLAGILADARVAALPRASRVLVYCWRGGDRSGSLAHALSRVGWHVARLDGGYKAYRARVRAALYDEARLADLRCVAVGGATGSAKGRVLDALAARGAQVVDLEGLARHRGSILGALPGAAQPSQKAFESALVRALRDVDLSRPVFLELESPKIGRVDVPRPLFKRLAAAPVVEVVLPLAERVAWIRANYAHFEDGREGTAELKRLLDFCAPTAGKKAVARWKALADDRAWDAFVEAMLLDHYDPGYARSRKRDRAGAGAAADAPFRLDLASTADADVGAAAETLLREFDPRALGGGA